MCVELFLCLDRNIPLSEWLDMIGMDQHGMGAPHGFRIPS